MLLNQRILLHHIYMLNIIYAAQSAYITTHNNIYILNVQKVIQYINIEISYLWLHIILQ